MDIDFSSPTWLQVAEWARLRIEQLRVRNDGALDPTETASLRGQIKAYRSLLGLPEAAARESSAGPAASSSFGG